MCVLCHCGLNTTISSCKIGHSSPVFGLLDDSGAMAQRAVEEAAELRVMWRNKEKDAAKAALMNATPAITKLLSHVKLRITCGWCGNKGTGNGGLHAG